MERIARDRLFSSQVVAIVAGIALGSSVPLCHAEEASTVRPPSALSVGGTVAPVAAKAPAVTFGRCHYERTPAHDPQVSLECPAGEVVVAVYAEGVRCCALEIR